MGKVNELMVDRARKPDLKAKQVVVSLLMQPPAQWCVDLMSYLLQHQ